MSEMIMFVSDEQNHLKAIEMHLKDESKDGPTTNDPEVVTQYAASVLVHGRMVDGVPGPVPVAIKQFDDRVF